MKLKSLENSHDSQPLYHRKCIAVPSNAKCGQTDRISGCTTSLLIMLVGIVYTASAQWAMLIAHTGANTLCYQRLLPEVLQQSMMPNLNANETYGWCKH